MTREIKFRAWDKKEGKIDDELFNLSEEVSKDITLMQYTGLKDKKNVEIYEGDIAKQMWNPFQKDDKEPEIGEIRIETTRGVCVGNKPIWIHDVEVIGNIYQNPELLTK